MTERKPVKGEVWTCSPYTWTCIDDEPDTDGFYGWLLDTGQKRYKRSCELTPPKPERPEVAKGWRTIHTTTPWIGHAPFMSAADCHAFAHANTYVANYLGALNLETGEWVPRP